MSMLRITLKKSFIGRQEKQIKTAKALGLTKVGRTVEHEDNPSIRGAIQKIGFMLDVEEVQ
ncbi:50S ribosomal protein L30 [uncultured Murdochiella sp.]|uniref:50S ribosomal protein L30 n=1 Tax=uncultured Murdochiella sp. TaxID=1586095 RepID=UPI002804DB4E|nr:50S ribosomal protein L30 [uncultured Murdochiella sp.]